VGTAILLEMSVNLELEPNRFAAIHVVVEPNRGRQFADDS
jgi:hypothetical protein